MSPFQTSIAVAIALLASAVLLFLPVATVFALLPALVAGIIILKRPFLALMLYALIATFAPYATLQLGFRITVPEVLLLAGWAGVGLCLLKGERMPDFGRTERAVLALMLCSVIPFLAGEVMTQGSSGLMPWIRWQINVSCFFLMLFLVRSPQRAYQVALAILLGTGAMAAVSLATFIHNRGGSAILPVLHAMHYVILDDMESIMSGEVVRLGSPWIHPNMLGGMLAMLLPINFFLLQRARGWLRVLLILVTLCAIAALLLSISRGAIVALALVMIGLAARGFTMARRIILVAGILGVVVVSAYPPLQEKLGKMFSSSNESTQVRFDEYRKFPDAVARYPLGIGFKSNPPPAGTDLLGISNLWLNYMYKLGALGMGIFIAITVFWWRQTRPPADHPDPDLSIGLRSALLTAILTGLFDHYFSFSEVAISIFWGLMGLSVALARHALTATVLDSTTVSPEPIVSISARGAA